LPGFYYRNWHGLWAPKGASRSIIAKLDIAVIDAISDPQCAGGSSTLGRTFPCEQQTPAALGAYQKAAIPIIKAANIKANGASILDKGGAR
jgi:hypothetical protein